jgi:hypothetical protein
VRPTEPAPRGLAPAARLLLVAVAAAFCLVAAPVPARSVGPSPAPQDHLERRSVEAVPILNRRPAVPWEIAVPAVPVLVVAFALVGLLAVTVLTRTTWAPGRLPVQRGPPSSR